jgi:hypothetical protein
MACCIRGWGALNISAERPMRDDRRKPSRVCRRRTERAGAGRDRASGTYNEPPRLQNPELKKKANLRSRPGRSIETDGPMIVVGKVLGRARQVFSSKYQTSADQKGLAGGNSLSSASAPCLRPLSYVFRRRLGGRSPERAPSPASRNISVSGANRLERTFSGPVDQQGLF